ncbi:ImmA/IrrE family metallo-endopeptidase [Aneurinibacillus sp. Ricciae_BoGa-3]|uniref:ImmA/IrrE family metallo-endopeptidase n=1 Tax=Aneurinibacillus sp. Ricciae_BoGa-3 TaxID=3022697 RepID=UPI0023420FA1|nr:ImmA/IrrE family metallo-endopeptidase [Aneurinibacillus sp. Ricciae_BoGa-3]WCK53882.1 ImmA/IrrE family metallo-endopeptidase [Aneurinibacillus sp. Ricciae_BoGa-3]
MDVGKVVKKLITQYKTRNPFEIAEYKKIHIQFSELPSSIRGMAVKALRQKYIILNQEMHHFEQRAVCAHELGHHFLHPGSSYRFIEEHSLFSPGRFEREANEFAAALLIDSSLIEIRDTNHIIANKAEVPVELVGYYKPFSDMLVRGEGRVGMIKMV